MPVVLEVSLITKPILKSVIQTLICPKCALSKDKYTPQDNIYSLLGKVF